jgi:hypothetical protein
VKRPAGSTTVDVREEATGADGSTNEIGTSTLRSKASHGAAGGGVRETAASSGDAAAPIGARREAVDAKAGEGAIKVEHVARQ